MSAAADRPTVALMVSGHGFGHAVRAAEVARVLCALGTRVLVRTDAPAWLFPDAVEHLPSPGWPVDIGVAQRGGLEIDIDETRRVWADFAAHLPARARDEARMLRNCGAQIVVGDIPPLAFLAAREAGLPSIAVANFTWDWIYGAWTDFEATVEAIRSAYACADVLLRLPLHARSADAFVPFRRIEDVPLIARHARRPRHEVRADLNIGDDAVAVLLSFGGFTARGLSVDALGAWPRYTFIVSPPLADSVDARTRPENVVALAQPPADYVSLLAACDAAITKPGYGMAADCLANRVPVLFTDRGPFREYDVLATALPELGRARYIPQPALLRGDVGPHLDALMASTAPWQPLRLDGARAIAEHVRMRLSQTR